MKFFNKAFGILLSLGVIITSTMSADPVFAATLPSSQADSSPGILVETETLDNHDGTYIVDKLYIEPSLQTYSSSTTTGSTRCTKVREYRTGLGGSNKFTLDAKCSVTATFRWNKSTKTVTVSKERGKIINYGGGKITNKKVTTEGSGTSKASARYSCKYNTDLGGYKMSVKMSCKYNGKVS